MDARFYEGANPGQKDFDIGQFVRSYDALKAQFDEFNTILQKTDSLRRWEVPSVTLLCCVFVITICVSFPELLLASCLFPIPLILLLTGIRNVGQSKKKQIRNIFVTAVENEEQKLNKKKEAIAKAAKDLRRFIKIMCELQFLLHESRKKIDYMRSFFSWDNPQLTLRFVGFTFLLMVLLILVPLSFIILILFLLLFFYNDDFKSVLIDYLTLLKVYVPVPESVPNKQDDEWFDAFDVDNEESERSSFEDESSGSDFEEITALLVNSVSQSASERRTRSLVSNISKYRKLRKELNKGSCAACKVAFSSLLTRRRYCRRCGDKFCSKCCRHYVTKAALGATAPGSRDQRVVICNDCYGRIRATKVPD